MEKINELLATILAFFENIFGALAFDVIFH